MPNKCAVYGCKTAYETTKDKSISTFSFPLASSDKSFLVDHWVRFVNRSDWKPTKNSVICGKHFESKFILTGKQRNFLDWKLNPIPTLHTDKALKKPSLLPTMSVPRKTPKLRVYQEDQLGDFNSIYLVRSFEELCKKDCLTGFNRMVHQDAIIYYNVVFHEDTMMPKIHESIKVSKDMHVTLEYEGNPVPLPTWFVRGRDARFDNLTQLEEFLKYMRDCESNNEYSIFSELEKRKMYKPKGRPPFSSEMIRFALLVRHTSAQAYRLMLEKFPFHLFLHLQKFKKVGLMH